MDGWIIHEMEPWSYCFPIALSPFASLFLPRMGRKGVVLLDTNGECKKGNETCHPPLLAPRSIRISPVFFHLSLTAHMAPRISIPEDFYCPTRLASVDGGKGKRQGE